MRREEAVASVGEVAGPPDDAVVVCDGMVTLVVVDDAVVGWAALDGDEAVEEGEETETGDDCPLGCAV